MKEIVLAGGTGHLGQLLKTAFVKRGNKVIILTRGEKKSRHPLIQYVQWDGKHLGAWTKELEEADALVNLSGERIDKRFTKENKILLTKSRIEPTLVLGEAISQLSHPPNVWINFSGVSIFEGVNSISDEYNRQYGHGFLADLTKKWEEAFYKYDLLHTKRKILRVSPVLTPTEGLFASLYPLAKWGLAGTIGSGKQYMPWVHHEDFVRIVHWLVDGHAKQTIYHACVPHAVNNKQFMRALRRAAGSRVGIPLPALFAKIGAYLKGLDPSLLLGSTPVVSKALVDEGFEFNYTDPGKAFSQLRNLTLQ